LESDVISFGRFFIGNLAEGGRWVGGLQKGKNGKEKTGKKNLHCRLCLGSGGGGFLEVDRESGFRAALWGTFKNG